MPQVNLTHEEASLIRLALYSWSERCDREMITMAKLADELPDKRDKCLANVAASREFKARCEALLEKWP